MSYPVIVHLIDGTYELFRHFYGFRRSNLPPTSRWGRSPACSGRSCRCSQEGATHIGVATDHVIESFRNELWPGYKTGEGIDPALWAQFHPLEEALVAMGVDDVADGRARGRRRARIGRASRGAGRAGREGVHLDAGQGSRAVRRRAIASCRSIAGAAQIRDDARVRDKVRRRARRSSPTISRSSATRRTAIPGIAGIGAKTAARLITQHGHIEQFPASVLGEQPRARAALQDTRDAAHRCAALRRCRRSCAGQGPTPAFAAAVEKLGNPRLAERVTRLKLSAYTRSS